MKRFNRWAVSLLFLGFATVAVATPTTRPESSGAGNGHAGDVIDRILAATRESLILSLTGILQGSGVTGLCSCEKGSDAACFHLKGLTPEQRNYCRGFIESTAAQLLRLARPTGTPFHLSMAPLTITGPNGERPVAAKTALGPTGPIVFHYGTLKTLSPISLLALSGHELGHKVEFGGPGVFVEDNPAVGPFNGVEGGRALLDAVGSGLAHYAAERGYVIQHFGIRDRFLCNIAEEGSPYAFSSPGSSPRYVRTPTGDAYLVGVSNLPQDMACAISADGGTSEIAFRVLIEEPGGCAKGMAGRRTTLELWRLPRIEGRKAEKLAERRWEGNPLCGGEEAKIPLRLEMMFGTRKLSFQVQHLGTYQRWPGFGITAR